MKFEAKHMYYIFVSACIVLQKKKKKLESERDLKINFFRVIISQKQNFTSKKMGLAPMMNRANV